jgi:hypothetical protein
MTSAERCGVGTKFFARCRWWHARGAFAVLAVLVGLAGFPAIATGQETDGQPPAPTPARAPLTEEEIRDVVMQLAADSFSDREAATARLLAIGTRSLPVLRQLKDVADPEMRQRIEIITDRLMNEDFETRAAAFLDGDQSIEMPGWEYTKTRFGDRLAHREVYVEFSRRFPAVVMLLDGSAAQRGEALDLLAEDLSPPLTDIHFSQAFGLALLSSDPEIKARPASDAILLSLMNRYEINDSLRNPELLRPFRAMLNQWIVKVSDEYRFNALVLSLRAELEQGVTLAKKVLKDSTEIELLELSLQILARFGEPADAAIIAPLLEDQRPSGRGYFLTDAAGRRLQVQMRDVAMATIATIHGRNLRDLGFPIAATHPTTAFDVDTLGFPIGEAGDQARGRVMKDIEELIGKKNEKEPVADPEAPASQSQPK